VGVTEVMTMAWRRYSCSTRFYKETFPPFGRPATLPARPSHQQSRCQPFPQIISSTDRNVVFRPAVRHVVRRGCQSRCGHPTVQFARIDTFFLGVPASDLG